MTFETIERDRQRLGIDQKMLCARANVHQTTYCALKTGRSGGNVATLARLRDALDQLLAARREPAR